MGEGAARATPWYVRAKQRNLQNETLKLTQTGNGTAQMLFLGDVMAIGGFKNLIKEQ
jgi:hypothetical protein